MRMTLLLLLALAGFVSAVAAAMGKAPAWLSPLLLALYCLGERIPHD